MSVRRHPLLYLGTDRGAGAVSLQSGWDCVRVIPQPLPALSRNLRLDVTYPTMLAGARPEHLDA